MTTLFMEFPSKGAGGGVLARDGQVLQHQGRLLPCPLDAWLAAQVSPAGLQQGGSLEDAEARDQEP